MCANACVYLHRFEGLTQIIRPLCRELLLTEPSPSKVLPFTVEKIWCVEEMELTLRSSDAMLMLHPEHHNHYISPKGRLIAQHLLREQNVIC